MCIQTSHILETVYATTHPLTYYGKDIYRGIQWKKMAYELDLRV